MAKLKRFPNPVSNIDMFIDIFKRTYPILSIKKYFSLYDMELAMIKENLVSSEGFTGIKAFAKSLREDASKDPIYNQAKMCAELYRILGWISSSPDKSLIFTITELGRIVASNDIDNKVVFKECIMGIADENLIIEKKDGLEMRPFKYFLNTIRNLDNKICKLELIYGPYRYPDKNIDKAIKDIKAVRGDTALLLNNILEFGKKNKIQKNTMENYTRFPIATLDYLNWVTKEKSQELYPEIKNMVVMTLTDQGLVDSDYYNRLRDIRIEEFNALTEEQKKALVYISFCHQLKRINIAYDFNQELMIRYENLLREVYDLKQEFLFSPYQMLPETYVNDVLHIKKIHSSSDLPIKKNDLLNSVESYEEITTRYITEIKFQTILNEIPSKLKRTEIYHDIIYLKDYEVKEIVHRLMKKYENSNKDIFYPLIGDLFCILGFDCKVSRNGTNYERYDAIIIDRENSIPIEIKSPREEINISVKAVRQALENKIILISREIFPTVKETSSFVVGYKLPNERAEVITLIDDIKKTFGFNIGILDFESLLRMVIHKVLLNKVVIGNELYVLKGMVSLDE